MRTYSGRCMLAVVAVVTLVSSQAAAAFIVFDGFDGAGNGVTISGRTPSDANLPGDTWVRATNQDPFRSTHTAGYGNPLPGTFGTPQAASAISIASAGGYTKPTKLQISADIAPRNLDGPASDGRGIALGFYSTVGTSQVFSQNHFTGLVLDSAGYLNLVHDPNPTGFFGSGSVLGTPIAFDGTWDADLLRRLSYEVDTTTGAINNISLEGSSATYSFTTALFTDANTAYAGMYTSSSSGGTRHGALDNFQVVPEPGAWLLALIALACGLLVRRRK